ncbi:hypothetical protein POM88_034725 [Heracleum sosnowskyi]|uniref:Uncharacterized protein n=1 Tax=Heracleum sosnowskyi TaxID=360622 RepID=A0AAD8HKV5_9APIA|nr:hypothetical protein POM88_034725 [Heracleum sosnowskyi]
MINETLHLPVSNFEKLPTDDEIISMFKFIKYARRPWQLSQLRRKYLRKEWSYFFVTLTRAFAPRCGGFNVITRFIQKIAYSLMYRMMIDIGTLLFKEFSTKLGDMVHRSKVVFYARLFMIIAYYLSKEFSIDDRDDMLQVFVQGKRLFSKLVTRNLHDKVEFVLARHVQVQLSTLSSSSLVTPKLEDVREDPAPPTQVELPSQSQSVTRGTSSVSHTGKRKRTTLPTIIEDGSEKNETSSEVHSPQKKKDESEVKPARSDTMRTKDVINLASSAQDELSTAKTKVDSLKSKKEELTDALRMLTEELYEEEERVKTLTAEMDQFQEAHSDIEFGIVKLDAEKKEASVAFKAFNTAKEEFERISTHLLQLVKQKGGICWADIEADIRGFGW